MTRSTLYRVAIATAVAGSLLGCDRRQVSEADLQRAPTREELEPRKEWTDEAPTATGGGPVDSTDAVARIVEARCARDANCGFVGGTDKKWSTTSACTNVITRDYSDDLTDAECPSGVDRRALEECVEASRNADCNDPIDVIGRVAACRTSKLCPRSR